MTNKGVTPAIGIDLWERVSCVGVWRQQKVEIIPNEQGNRITPSIVAFTPTERVVGEAAKNLLTSNPANTIYDVIRLLGRKFSDPEVQEGIKSWPFKVIEGKYGLPKVVVTYKGKEKKYSAEEIASMVLLNLKNQAESYLGTTVSDAVITVPTYFDDSQRQATMCAAHLAGLDAVQIVNGPILAAIAYRQHMNAHHKNVLIFHLDAYTFDVSLVNTSTLKFMATCGHHTHFGGQTSIVSIMVDTFVKEFNRKHNMDLSGNLRALGKLRYHSERAIQDLSSNAETNIYIDCLHESIDFCTTITMKKYEHILRSLFSMCIETVASCLRDANINKTGVDDVVLVGESTRMPKVQQLLREFFNGKELCMSIEPEEVVAYGAAIHAEYVRNKKSEKLKKLPLVDTVPLSLGVDAHDGVFSVIIPRNTPIPVEKENIYFTTRDNQDSISFNVYQGERSRAKDNNWLGKFDVTVSLVPKGKSKVKVIFKVDADGTLNLWVKEFTTGLQRKVTIDNDKVKRSEEEIEKMVNDAVRHRLEDREYERIMCARNVLEEYIYNVKKKVKKIGSTDKTRIHAEEIKKMENAIEVANQQLDESYELTDDDYQKVVDQLEKVCISVISQLV